MLFAPQQGTELRGRLREYANRAKETLVEVLLGICTSQKFRCNHSQYNEGVM